MISDGKYRPLKTKSGRRILLIAMGEEAGKGGLGLALGLGVGHRSRLGLYNRGS